MEELSISLDICPVCGATHRSGPSRVPFIHAVAGCQGQPVTGVWVSEGNWPCYVDDQGQVTLDTGAGGDEDEGDTGDDADVPDTIDPDTIDPTDDQ